MAFDASAAAGSRLGTSSNQNEKVGSSIGQVRCQLVLETCDVKRNISWAWSMKEKQNLPAPCHVNSFCSITFTFSFTFLPLQYEKDVQLIKRKKEESEGRAAAGRDVLEPQAFDFAMTHDPRHSRKYPPVLEVLPF